MSLEVAFETVESRCLSNCKNFWSFSRLFSVNVEVQLGNGDNVWQAAYTPCSSATYNNVRQGCTTSLRQTAENSRSSCPRAGWGFGTEGAASQLLEGLRSTVWSSPVGWGPGKAPAANAFWCILSSKIASGGNFFRLFISAGKKVEMVHFDAFWNMPILPVCLIIENHRKYLPDFGMNWNRTIRSCRKFKKKCAPETSNGPIF